ncbi:RICIN domain-containing protein [Maribellus sediminis]|uniref:RICIN domain-containing protein n=1 Tax=Maribellus sediminis TaxID=2696285 RepID=UPI0014319287|nr:RICIN domain-containing protein [Maribellus sediminis]
MRIRQLTILIILFGFQLFPVAAQNPELSDEPASAGDILQAFPLTDRTVNFNLSDNGEHKDVNWGLDLAWRDKNNIIRGMAFMGPENVDIIRSSFMPTEPLLGDTALQGGALIYTKERIKIINDLLGPNTKVALNCDHPSVHSYFQGNAVNWANLIDVTTKMHQEAGFDVVTVSPFNEPDYSYTGQGTIDDFYNIIRELNKIPRFDSIRISGGNTLNNDQALYWYNYLNPAGLEEGNTHQLAGSFETYAEFFQAVRTNNDHATADEMHNVMDAMVGLEYGLQTGIWWGWAEYARGEFCKVTKGERLGYAEHRPNWTAASVYRGQDGKVQAFCGSSERQAVSTTYTYISKDRDVYYDGYGPQRQFILEMPGGTGYQQGQTNAEKVINITWGDDIQPIINGRYLLVNRNSGKVMEVAGGSAAAGTNVRQATSNAATYQQWNVTPVDARVGGDFSYFSIKVVNSGKSIDVYNWSLENGGNIAIWDDTKGSNQQWYLEYAEDGWFYIRSRHSAKCLEVANNSTANGANIQQWDVDGGTNQHWRFIPVDAPVEFDAPDAPTNLVATANAESVRLDWTASPEDDVEEYTIFRSELSGGPYNTIARNVKSTAFVDNTCTTGGQYYYKIKAVDKSLNSSVYSAEVEAITTGDHDLVAHYKFNENTRDSSINLNHGATFGAISYVQGKAAGSAIELNGEDAFVQLPATIASQEEITIATWVHWNGGSLLQRIFEFANDDSEYMYLTPMLFAIKNGGSEKRLTTTALPEGEWAHIAITLGEAGVRMYLNGEMVKESAEINIRPIEFKPILNYIGRDQKSVRLFNGSLDDFRIYNYELSGEEIAAIYEDIKTDVAIVAEDFESSFAVYPNPVNKVLKFSYSNRELKSDASLKLYNVFGSLVLEERLGNKFEGELIVSALPAGIYLLTLTNGEELTTKKIIVRH